MTLETDLGLALRQDAIHVDTSALRAGVEQRFARRRIRRAGLAVALAVVAVGFATRSRSHHGAIEARRVPSHHRAPLPRALPRTQSSDPAEALTQQAWDQLDQDPAGAYAILQRVVDEYPASPFAAEAALGLAERDFEAKNLDRSLALYQKVPPNTPIYRYAQFKIGWVYVNTNDKTEAIAAFERSIAGTPTGPDVQLAVEAQRELDSLRAQP